MACIGLLSCVVLLVMFVSVLFLNTCPPSDCTANVDTWASYRFGIAELYLRVRDSWYWFVYARAHFVRIRPLLESARSLHVYNVTFCSIVSNEIEALRMNGLYANLSRVPTANSAHDEWLILDNRDHRQAPLFSRPAGGHMAVQVLDAARISSYDGAFTNLMRCLEVHQSKIRTTDQKRNLFVKIDPDAYVVRGKLYPMFDDIVYSCDTRGNSHCFFGHAMHHPMRAFMSGLIYGITFEYPIHLVNKKDELYAAEDVYFADVLTRAQRSTMSWIDLHAYLEPHDFNPNSSYVVQHASWKIFKHTI
jgi:hypothetical protein